jgi:YebC/PmpR family DNA-binding regulatory protein
MAGHSHSANIKRRKDAVDAKRGKIFSKCARHIMSAARTGGGDPEANLTLKYAIERAKAANMPKDGIQRAIKKGAGEKGGDAFEELVYEGYAPGGIALMVACLTDNRHRTAPEVKHLFDKRGGSLGTPGSVSFLFEHRSIIVVRAGELDEDALMELALETGADDVELDEDLATFLAPATDFLSLKQGLEERGLEFVEAEVGYVPTNWIEPASLEDAKKVARLIEQLEELEDVQNVYANADYKPEWADELTSGN